MRVGIRMNLIVEEVEPKARRHTLHLFAVHCIQNQFFFRYSHNDTPFFKILFTYMFFI